MVDQTPGAVCLQSAVHSPAPALLAPTSSVRHTLYPTFHRDSAHGADSPPRRRLAPYAPASPQLRHRPARQWASRRGGRTAWTPVEPPALPRSAV